MSQVEVFSPLNTNFRLGLEYFRPANRAMGFGTNLGEAHWGAAEEGARPSETTLNSLDVQAAVSLETGVCGSGEAGAH